MNRRPAKNFQDLILTKEDYSELSVVYINRTKIFLGERSCWQIFDGKSMN